MVGNGIGISTAPGKRIEVTTLADGTYQSNRLKGRNFTVFFEGQDVATSLDGSVNKDAGSFDTGAGVAVNVEIEFS